MKRIFPLILVLVLLVSALSLSTLADGERNLAIGAEYTVQTGEPVSNSYGASGGLGEGYDINNGQLTDQKTATLSESSEGWYRAYGARSRIVTVDLGELYGVTAVEAGFLQAAKSGILTPRVITVSVSADGVGYQKVEAYQTGYNQSYGEPERNEFIIALGASYCARYVRVEFSVDGVCCCDEIRVLGRSTASSDKKPNPDQISDFPGAASAVAGAKNIVRLTNGVCENGVVSLLDEEHFLPYIAYLDSNGNINGKLFDAVLLSPAETPYPSGGAIIGDNASGVMSDWSLYLESTLRDLTALDSASKMRSGAIGKSEKIRVFLTLPRPNPINSPFGDVNGDGLDEYCRTVDERISALEWYVKEAISSVTAMKYSAIQLVGFVWCDSRIDYSASERESELASRINSLIGKRGYSSVFVCDYLASGFDEWKRLGFSACIMNPDLTVSENKFTSDMLPDYWKTVSRHGLGTGLQTPELSAFEGESYEAAGRLYESQLYYTYKSNNILCLKLFDQSSGALSEFCLSGTSSPRGIYLRRLYDLTHSFIMGTYKNNPPTLSVPDFELYASDGLVRVDIELSDPDSHFDDLAFEFPIPPENGSVTVASTKKTLIYKPNSGFVGEDRFTVRVTDGFGYSELQTVTVTVHGTGGETSISPEESDFLPTYDSVLADREVPALFTVILVLMGIAIVVVAVITVTKNRQ